MRVVLYTEDMEPITVISLSKLAHSLLMERGVVRVPVYEPMKSFSVEAVPHMEIERLKTVTIRAETTQRNGERHLMLFTGDDEAALMLKSELLPGQRRDAQKSEKQQYARGFLHGLSVTLGK